LKAPVTKRLKLKCEEPLLNFAFNFNLRRYIMGEVKAGLYEINITAFGNPVGGARKMMQWWGSFTGTLEIEAQFKGANMMASASIEADYRAGGGNTTQLNSTITLEFEVNAWPFERGALSEAAGTTAGALGESNYHKVGRRRLPISKPVLKAPMV